MNAVEIEEAISKLASQPFDSESFPYAFLAAFGNKDTTIKRLKSGSSNASDIDGGVLQRNNIHISVCDEGNVTNTLGRLKTSPATSKARAKFILATDGSTLEAEDLTTGETVACTYSDFPNHFGFFLPLAGITTVKQIRNNPIDIQATGRLNRLYLELLKTNEDWASHARRHEMNQFMARLIFCFFAEDTEIFSGENLFTSTVAKMSDSRSDNTHEVIGELFRAMDTKPEDRETAKIARWADAFPWVNGGLFAGSKEIPRFSRMARSYLLHAGNLNWQEINPDIFGSMIQAVADDDERGELGMHYTSVPNILKVLNPLFLDDLREQLEQAADNPRKLLNLRKRIANIRVFDPACGSGNFLVIAYMQMREIEAGILRRRGEQNERSWIKLDNFYGIELKNFACEVARLSLLIAEFQCDVRLIGQKEAKQLVLPLKRTGQIHCNNALRMEWRDVCQSSGGRIELQTDSPFQAPLDQDSVESETEGVETYICGNPPFLGSTYQTKQQKSDLGHVFQTRVKSYAAFDYVAAWFYKASEYIRFNSAVAAFVSTNSICQGYSAASLWPHILGDYLEIGFAHKSFRWKNNASENATVTCAIIGLRKKSTRPKRIYENNLASEVRNINAYLVNAPDIYIEGTRKGLFELPIMDYGNKPVEGGNLILTPEEARSLAFDPKASAFIRPFKGSQEVVKGIVRFCVWIDDHDVNAAMQVEAIAERVSKVRELRLKSTDRYVVEKLAPRPHAFKQVFVAKSHVFLVPRHTSELRPYLPADIASSDTICSDSAMALYDCPIWAFAIFSTKLHLVWIATVCGKLETRYRYSNTLGWNTFPVPKLTEKNTADLTRCAEDILLTREAHFPKTIADLYDPENMPEDLRRAHDRNDEVLERIYIGRRFKNDTERLEKLFELYTKTTAKGAGKDASAKEEVRAS